MSNKYSQYLDKTKQSLTYWQELSILEFTEDLARLLKQKNMTQSELAKKIGKSAPYISKVMNGNANFTLKTMTKLARALDSVVHVHVAPESAHVHWLDEHIVKYKPIHDEVEAFLESARVIPSSEKTATFSESLSFSEVNEA